MDDRPATPVQQALQGVPMAALISAPLEAAAEAQRNLSQATVDYMLRLGVDEGSSREARMLEFSVKQPVETSDGIVMNELSVQAPLLALAPIPSLAVEEVVIDFQMEVTASESLQEKTEVRLSEDSSGSSTSEPSRVAVSGKVSSSAAQTRETNQSAKYQIHVSAKRQEPTEAMSRLLDILAASVAPRPLSRQ
jgi:hypothetical protein